MDHQTFAWLWPLPTPPSPPPQKKEILAIRPTKVSKSASTSCELEIVKSYLMKITQTVSSSSAGLLDIWQKRPIRNCRVKRGELSWSDSNDTVNQAFCWPKSPVMVWVLLTFQSGQVTLKMLGFLHAENTTSVNLWKIFTSHNF